MKRYCILYSSVILVVAGIATSSGEQAALAANSQSTSSVLASGEDTVGWGLRCEILEVKRVSGDALLIRWRLIGSQQKDARYDWITGEEAYYIDNVVNRKYSVLRAGDNAIGGLLKMQTIEPDQQRIAWAKFPAPPAATKKISIYIFGFIPFEDVPVSQ